MGRGIGGERDRGGEGGERERDLKQIIGKEKKRAEKT